MARCWTAVVNGTSQFYDQSVEKTYEVEAGLLTSDEAEWMANCLPPTMFSAFSWMQPTPMIRSCSLQSLSRIQPAKSIMPIINLTPSSSRGDMPTTVLASACQPRPAYSFHPITSHSPDGTLNPHIHRPNNVQQRWSCRYFRCRSG